MGLNGEVMVHQVVQKGNWYNPNTGEILHLDLDHPQPIGPHWDFRDILRQWWRIFKNGKFPK